MYANFSASPIEKSNANGSSRQRSRTPRLLEVDEPAGNASPWCTIAQFVKKHEVFTENAMRAHVAAAAPRKRSARSAQQDEVPGNGLAPAIRRIGRRVVLHEPLCLRWIDTGSCDSNGEIA